MIDPGRLLVLDTAILVRLARNDAVGKQIRSEFDLESRLERPLISIVTVGEMRSLARQWRWGEEKLKVLDGLVHQLVVVRLSQGNLIRRYAELDYHSHQTAKPARPLGENDTWIAATAMAVDGVLLTSDTDFDHFAPRFFGLIRVDAKSGKTVRTALDS